MNRYNIQIPYNYVKFGDMSCQVYAEDSEAAAELARDYDSRYNENYDDCDDSGDTNYEYENIEIELDEEDVEPPTPHNYNSKSSFSKLPSYFLNEINLI